MSVVQQLRSAFTEALEPVAEGWQKLYHKALGAITRFTPNPQPKDAEVSTVRNSGWGVLAAEVFEDNDRLVVRVEVPGMEKNDFDIQVQDNHLLIRGEKHLQRERRQGTYHITERAYGHFSRMMPLPRQVKTDEASATYDKGVLQITLPLTEPVSHRKIRKIPIG